MIESTGGDGRAYKLVDSNGLDAVLNSYFDRYGISYKLEGGRAPQHEGSTGRVWMRPDGSFQREFFPSVFDLQWVRK